MYIKNLNLADEFRMAKLNIQNTESLLKDCAALQVKQQNIIKQYKENLIQANSQLERV